MAIVKAKKAKVKAKKVIKEKVSKEKISKVIEVVAPEVVNEDKMVDLITIVRYQKLLTNNINTVYNYLATEIRTVSKKIDDNQKSIAQIVEKQKAIYDLLTSKK